MNATNAPKHIQLIMSIAMGERIVPSVEEIIKLATPYACQ